jgi:hypothetical protein
MSAAAAEPTVGSYEDLTYKVLPREYGDANIQFIQDYYNSKLTGKFNKNFINTTKEKYLKIIETYKDMPRNIVIRTIPKGTLLYHYYQNDFYEATNSKSRETYRKMALIRYYSRFGFESIHYNESDDSVTFELSRSLASPKYFFGVPHAVYGVDQGETIYNTLIPVVVKEDMHVAFLKSGADINDQTIMHRGYPKNFNFQRVMGCKSIQIYENNVSKFGSDSDACLRKEFASAESLDGVAAIGAMDSLFNEWGKTQSLYWAIDHYSKQIQTRVNEFEINILNILMLALDYDQRDKSTIQGYTEYALHPFGKRGYKGEHFLPHSTNGLYTIVNEVVGERQQIQTSFSNFKAVFETYIRPNLIVDPLCVIDITRSNKDAVFYDTAADFMDTLITPGKYPSQIERNAFGREQVVDPAVFFDWLLHNKHTILYNPLINMFGISKMAYPFSYPPGDFRYRNGFIVNEKLPYKDLAKRDFTNVSLGGLMHVLTFVDPAGIYRFHSPNITTALEAKLFRGSLNARTVDYESELNTVYLYQPIWNGANLDDDDIPINSIKRQIPKLIVYAGNRREIYSNTLFNLLQGFYMGLHSPYILDVENLNYNLYINTYKYTDDRNEDDPAYKDFVVLGTIVPPTADAGGSKKRYRKTRRGRKMKRRGTRRTK